MGACLERLTGLWDHNYMFMIKKKSQRGQESEQRKLRERNYAKREDPPIQGEGEISPGSQFLPQGILGLATLA